MNLTELEELLHEACNTAIKDGFVLTPSVTVLGHMVCPIGALAVNAGITDSGRAWEYAYEVIGWDRSYPKLGAFGQGFDGATFSEDDFGSRTIAKELHAMGVRFREKYVPEGAMIEP